MEEKWWKQSGIFVELDDNEIDYLVKNVKSFRVWSFRKLELVTKSCTYNNTWHKLTSCGGIEILSNDDIVDLFKNDFGELDTRSIVVK